MTQPKLTKEMIQAFIMHPDWYTMMDYIESHFERSTSIQDINVGNPSTTVHAEVIATQKIEADVQSLRNSFENLRHNYGKSKKSLE